METEISTDGKHNPCAWMVVGYSMDGTYNITSTGIHVVMLVKYNSWSVGKWMESTVIHPWQKMFPRMENALIHSGNRRFHGWKVLQWISE